jgi:hypothetical protein
MFVEFSKAALTLTISAIVAAPVLADDSAKKSKFEIALTQESAPDSKPWEDPARLSYSVIKDAPDEASIQANLELGFNLTEPNLENLVGRKRTVGSYFRYQRETGSDKQNNLEFGAKFNVGYDIIALLGIPAEYDLTNVTPEKRKRLAEIADQRGEHTDIAYELSTGYAYTESYPDQAKAPCVTTPALPQCATQTKKSIRSSFAATVFNGNLENRAGNAIAFSIAPKFGLDHDFLLNNPLDLTTGLGVKGGYLSATGGIAIVLTPSFINPGWEIKASSQFRYKLDASSSRSPTLESLAEKFEVSGTYYFVRPATPTKKGWRAGVGLAFSTGGDPLTGKPDEKKLVLAFRLGKY